MPDNYSLRLYNAGLKSFPTPDGVGIQHTDGSVIVLAPAACEQVLSTSGTETVDVVHIVAGSDPTSTTATFTREGEGLTVAI